MVKNVWAALAAMVVLAGCERVQQTEAPPAIENKEAEYMVAVVPDMSGSFTKLMAEDGLGYRFLMAVIDKYFRERLGSDDRLIISQISAVPKVCLWDGQPKQLRKHFASANDFTKFLKQNSNPAGSRCYQGLADTIEYVLTCPGVAEGRVRTAVLCMSDMDDNAPDGVQQKERLKKLLAQYAKTKSVIGLYWVSGDYVQWQQTLRETGFKNFVVESSIRAEPALPNFASD